jgi:outer membrane protein assembly factor BamB
MRSIERWPYFGMFCACPILAVCLIGASDAVGAPSHVRITASDAAPADFFGIAVSIYESKVLVGAIRDDDAGTNSGSAYLFDVATGQQLFKFSAADGQAVDFFGTSVAVSENFALVGAPLDDDRGINSGSAYLFDVTTGQQLFKFAPTDLVSTNGFGNSVAVNGNLALVGVLGGSSAYVFDTTTGAQLHKLQAIDVAQTDGFGSRVAIDGNRILIGSREDDDHGSASGSAYLFDAASGQQLIKLTASDAAEGDQFGSAVALHGNLAVVGAYRKDNSGLDSGAAYVFDATTGQELFKITPNNPKISELFGYSVAMFENRILVGAFQEYPGSPNEFDGTAYLFDASTGQQLWQVSDGSPASGFGRAVGIHQNAAVVGAYLHDAAGADAGAAFLYLRIPEPSTVVLLLIGVMGIALRDVRRIPRITCP